jgi:hypothetical protein
MVVKDGCGSVMRPDEFDNLLGIPDNVVHPAILGYVLEIEVYAVGCTR